MKTPSIGAAILIAVGAVLVCWGLFRPLIFVPVIHDVAYMDNDVAGIRCTYFAYVLIGLFAASIVCSLRLRRLPWLLPLLSAVTVALLCWSLYEIYRYRWGSLQEFADAGMVSIETIRKGLRAESGLWLIGGGLVVWLAGIVMSLCHSLNKGAAPVSELAARSEVVPL